MELDALSPEQLQSLVRQRIEASIDLDRYELQQEQEREDSSRIEDLRELTINYINEQRDDLGF